MTASDFRYIVTTLLHEGSMTLPYVQPQDLDGESISLLSKFFQMYNMDFSANYVQDSAPNLYSVGSSFISSYLPSHELRFTVSMKYPIPEKEIPVGVTDKMERSIDAFCAMVDL